jgi:hypothetical protein
LDLIADSSSFPINCSCAAARQAFALSGSQSRNRQYHYSSALTTAHALRSFVAHPRYRLSTEQEVIVRMPLYGTVMISALAGTGKTSTLLYVMLARPDVKFMLLCFNKA